VLAPEDFLASLVCVGFNLSLTLRFGASQIVHLFLVSLEFQDPGIYVEVLYEAHISLFRKAFIDFCNERDWFPPRVRDSLEGSLVRSRDHHGYLREVLSVVVVLKRSEGQDFC
jgi:hypothetical protein